MSIDHHGAKQRYMKVCFSLCSGQKQIRRRKAAYRAMQRTVKAFSYALRDSRKASNVLNPERADFSLKASSSRPCLAKPFMWAIRVHAHQLQQALKCSAVRIADRQHFTRSSNLGEQSTESELKSLSDLKQVNTYS